MQSFSCPAAAHLFTDSSSFDHTRNSSSTYDEMGELYDLLGPIPRGSWELSQLDARGDLPYGWGPERCSALDDSAASAASMVVDTDHAEQWDRGVQRGREAQWGVAGGGAVRGLGPDGAPIRRSLQDMLHEAQLSACNRAGQGCPPGGSAGPQQLLWDWGHPRTVTTGEALRTAADALMLGTVVQHA